MDAIELLKRQHDQVKSMFEAMEDAEGDELQELFDDVADSLTIHATIEEQLFYPECKRATTENILRESLEEHLSVKRILADLLELDADDEQFEAKREVLQEQVLHHVEEEESELFPKARELLGAARLRELGEEMESMAAGLEGTAPRNQVPEEIEHAPAL